MEGNTTIMKIYSKEETIKFLSSEIQMIYKFECPNCCQSFQSEEIHTKENFMNSLYENDGVRRVDNGAMIGIFCSDCYNDPEFENCTL